MSTFLKRLRPSPAMIVALLALFVAVGGTSYAASKITTNQIKNGAVTTKKIKNKAVKKKKLANGAVTSSKVADGSLKASDLAPGVIPTVPSNGPVTTVTANGIVTGIGTVEAECPAGTYVVSGGFTSSEVLAMSTGIAGNKWFVEVFNDNPAAITLTVTANCIPARG